MLFLWTAITGWAATLSLGSGIAIPYLLRATAAATSYARRLWPHYWLGFAIPSLAFAHAWWPMSAGHMRTYNQTGLTIATIALFVIFWQTIQGIALRSDKGKVRRQSRRVHFLTMAVIVLLVVTHIILNRA